MRGKKKASADTAVKGNTEAGGLGAVFFAVVVLFYFLVLVIEPRTSGLLGKYSLTLESCPQSFCF
jgi:hypothetical protein